MKRRGWVRRNWRELTASDDRRVTVQRKTEEEGKGFELGRGGGIEKGDRQVEQEKGMGSRTLGSFVREDRCAFTN